MKKFLLLILVSLFVMNTALASNSKILPEQLTRKDTVDYQVINRLSEKVFKKIITHINTGNMIEVYDNFPLIKNDGSQNPDYYYVSYKFVELLYNKDTNILEKIAIEKNHSPECWVIYDYPSGDLNSVEIHHQNSPVNFVFSPEGKYVNLSNYLINVREKIDINVESNSKLLFISHWRQKYHNVEVKVVIDRDGNLKKCDVVKSSNISSVDEKAVNAIKKAAPFEKFPKYAPNRDISINYIFTLSAQETVDENL